MENKTILARNLRKNATDSLILQLTTKGLLKSLMTALNFQKSERLNAKLLEQ